MPALARAFNGYTLAVALLSAATFANADTGVEVAPRKAADLPVTAEVARVESRGTDGRLDTFLDSEWPKFRRAL